MNEPINVKGMFRIQIGEDENGKQKVVGDSGWRENTVCEDGFDNYIVGAVGAVAGSKQVSHMQIATQTAAVNSTQTTLLGETRIRKTSENTLVGAGTMQATAEWSSSDNTATCAIAAAGLYNVITAGSLCAGQTFDVSTWATNQNVSATYQLRFS